MTMTDDRLRHLDRAHRAIADIIHCEEQLDAVFFSRRTFSIAPPPEGFFRPVDYTKRIYDQVEEAKTAYRRQNEMPSDDIPVDFAAILGHRLKDRREQLSLTQSELAEITGIRRPNIARLEKGSTLPNLATLLRLAAGLRISLPELLRPNNVSNMKQSES